MSEHSDDDEREEPTDDERASGDDETDGDADGTDPFSQLGDEAAAEGEGDPFSRLGDEGEGDGDAGVDGELGSRTPASDAGDRADELFEERDVETIDEEATWETVLGGGPEPGGVEGQRPPNDVVVPKRRYCEQCQYFTSPPETACTHEGTEILELVDTQHFRVRGCPVVDYRREVDAYPDPERADPDAADVGADTDGQGGPREVTDADADAGDAAADGDGAGGDVSGDGTDGTGGTGESD